MTISPGQLVEASPGVSSQTSDTFELLLSMRDILSTLQLDSISEILGTDAMQVHLGEDVQAVS